VGSCPLAACRVRQLVGGSGLAGEVVDVCFAGTPSPVGGIGWEALGQDVLANHGAAKLDNPGYYRDLKRGGEYHTHNSAVVDSLQAMAADHLLQRAIKGDSDELYSQFAKLVN